MFSSRAEAGTNLHITAIAKSYFVPDRLDAPVLAVVNIKAVSPDVLDQIPLRVQPVINTSGEIETEIEIPLNDIAVMSARARIGKWYQWGGTGPNRFDCAGLMSYAWAQAGIDIPHNTVNQWQQLRHFPLSEIMPGDLVFSSSLGHVYMYIGDGMVIHSPRTGQKVQIRNLPTTNVRLEIARPS
jgi:hypothetical protein